MELRVCILRLIFFLCGLSKILHAAPTVSDSLLSSSVLLTFSNTNLDTWRTEGKDLIMQDIIANLTTDYCQINHATCKVPINTRFESKNVKTVASYPKNKNGNLEILVYVEKPTNDNTSSEMLPGKTLLTIIQNNSSKLSSAVGYNLMNVVSGGTLSETDDKETNKTELNKIMIPVAFLLLVFIALVCWILHRGKKKRQAREERRRYAALKNSKSGSNIGENGGSMVNTADQVPSIQIQPEHQLQPDLDPSENPAEGDWNNNNVRRHKKKRASPRKPPIRNVSADESDDVFDDDSDEREKPKKRGRRRKGRRSYDLNHEHDTKATKELTCSQDTKEGSNGDAQVNAGYQMDSEKGESDPSRHSNTDSAVDLSSSVASSANLIENEVYRQFQKEVTLRQHKKVDTPLSYTKP